MFEQLLARIAKGLESLGIPYMVIGGQAVLVYGEPRLTRDIDVTLGLGPERWQEVADFARREGWQILAEDPADLVKKTLVLPCLDSSSGIRLDFIFSFSAYEQEALSRVRRVTVGNAQVCFASLEDLVIHKVVAGRPRDLEDVRSILLKQADFDRSYIDRWLLEFDRTLSGSFSRKFRSVCESVRSS